MNPRPPEPGASPAGRGHEGLDASGVDTAPARVLIVEDDASVADVLRDVLNDQPYHLTFAATGEEAMEAIGRTKPDLILTDISLPRITGLDVMRYARSRDPEVAVVLMTGYASVQTAIDALRQGADDYVTKPFEDIADIPVIVEKRLRNRRLKSENRALLGQLQRQNEVLQLHEQELRERVALATWQMRALYEVAKEIGANLELEPRLGMIAEKSAELIGARAAVVYLQNHETGEFRAAYAHGGSIEPREDGSPHFLAGEGVLGMSAFDLAPVRRAVDDGKRLDVPGVLGVSAQSLIAVPMVDEGQAIGVLVVLDKEGGFSADDQEFLALFASQAAVQIRNSQLFEHTKSLDRLKSDFVAVVSHEIRTPLTSIKGAVELLGDARYFQNTDQQAKLISIAHANAERLLLLINDILDFSKLEAAQLPMTIERQPIEPVVRQAVHNLRMLIEERRIQIDTQIPDDLPDALLDAHRIAQVLTNLLSNAIKFSTAGGKIHVSAVAHEGRELRISVRDFGEGIAAKDLPKLFRKFQQIDSGPTRRVGGTGLGLVICKGIVEQHDGRIWVESEPGRGSTFTFTIPVTERAVATAAAA